MSEELRPCPFCGKEVKFDDILGGIACFCLGADDREFQSIEHWNSAFCWKELEKKEAQIKELTDKNKELKAALTDYQNFCKNYCGRKIIILTEATEALEKLVSRLDYVHNDKDYFSVWQCAQNHQGKYIGPKYEKEFDAAKAALEKVRGMGNLTSEADECGIVHGKLPGKCQICAFRADLERLKRERDAYREVAICHYSHEGIPKCNCEANVDAEAARIMEKK